MNDTSAAAHYRVEQAQDYYKHVRCEIFPRIRSIVSGVSAFAAAVSPTPTSQAAFASVSVISAFSAVYEHFSRDAFGMSNSKWLKIASSNLAQAEAEEKKVRRQEQGQEQVVSSSAPKLDLGRS